MKSTTALKSLVAAAALAAFATGCAGARADTGTATPAGGSARDLAAKAGYGVHLDYTPLDSPRDAVSKGDLIVEGTLAEVTAGIHIRYPDAAMTEREANSYATFVIEVAKVIDGDAARVTGGKVYVAIPKSTQVGVGELAALNTRAKVVAVLDDVTTWQPFAGASVVRPAAIPAAGPLYMAYRDGLWLQGTQDAEMLAIDAEPDELAPAWRGADQVTEFAGELAQVASAD